MPRIYNMRTDQLIPADAIYVGRPSKWGNPFTVAEYGRGKAVEQYRTHALKRLADPYDNFVNDIKELTGHDLICWCWPDSCHAEVLLELANNEIKTK